MLNFIEDIADVERRHTTNATTNTGFTLLELLVVVAIIGVLAGLLLPALHRSKAKTATVVCANNLRQLQIQWTIYCDDHRDTPPPNYYSAGAGILPQFPSWIAGWVMFGETQKVMADCTNADLIMNPKYAVMAPYFKTVDIFRCPSDRSMVTLGGKSYPRIRSVSMNFYMNSMIRDEMGNLAWYLRCPAPPHPIPPDRAVFIDENEDTVGGAAFLLQREIATSWIDMPASRHNGRGAMSYVDGHVAFPKWTDPNVTRRPWMAPRDKAGKLVTGPDFNWLCDQLMGPVQ